MNKTKIKEKIMAASLAGVLILSVGGTSSAAAAENPQNTPAASTDDVKGTFKMSLNSDLQKFVDDKIITKEQADKIEEYFKKKREEHKAEFEKIRSMTKEEREKYIQNNLKQKKDPFDELVSSRIITKEQAEKLKDGFSKQRSESLQDTLKAEVSKGTISQEQLNKINEFMAKKREEREAEYERLKKMNEEERKAYIAQHPKNKTDILTELVSSGIITKEQSDALSRVLPQLHKGQSHKIHHPSDNT